MFPNSPNINLTLLSITSKNDFLGNKINIITSSKKVIGINKSITQSEYQTSVQLNIKYDFKIVIQSFLYDGSKFIMIKNKLYKVERTFVNGQFIELYLVSSDMEVKYD